MRQLKETELYSIYLSNNEQQNIMSAINSKIAQNVGVIAPEHIETELMQLKTRSKNSFFPLLNDAIGLFETRGYIRLFNLGNSPSGKSPIPTFMPFMPAFARNRVKEVTMGQGDHNATNPAVFMNMYRIGHWNSDESSYDGLNAITDLYSCLESGVIMYKMIVEHKSAEVFSDKNVLENLTRIYTYLFNKAVIKTKLSFGGDDFKQDAANFLIAKFFLTYVLKKPVNDTVHSFAHLSTRFRTSLTALLSFEDNADIRYDSLSSFLKSFGLAFFNSPINLNEFELNWIKMYGEGMIFSVEYAPYLLHYLFAAFHGSMLGGTVRLYNVVDDLKKNGLPKLYNAVIAAVR